jgi:hypothetical protein
MYHNAKKGKTMKSICDKIAPNQNAKDAGEAILQSMAGGLIEAAKKYRQYIENGGTDAELRAALPNIGSVLWNTLRAVADGRLDPRAIATGMDSQAGLSMLPISEQRKALDCGVEVLAVDGSALTVQVSAMTKSQKKQVFCGTHMRSLAEQRAWIESERRKEQAHKPKEANAQFEIRKGVLNVKVACSLTRMDLISILGKMEG